MKNRYFVIAGIIVAIIAVLVLSQPKIFRPGKLAGGAERVDSFTLSPGDVLSDCLSENGVPDTIAYYLIQTLSETFNPRNCKAGDKCEIGSTKKGDLAYFKYWPRPVEYYIVRRVSADSYALKKEKLELKKTIMGAEGNIETTLWEAMVAQGIPEELVARLTDIFECQVDFLTEPRKGDSYRLVWESYSGEHGFRTEGEILSAMYRGKESGMNLAIFFKGQHFDDSGKSLVRQFLRAPLSYRRISSYFTRRRFHPILRYFRPHLGIDYAAGRGTPVVSIGDGTVIYRGWKGGFGNYVSIRHDSMYVSNYGHLSRFGKGIRNGTRVSKGQVIGYVGSTGLSTGPHLDFRVYKYGSPINYLRLKFPPMKSVDKKDMPVFEEAKKTAIRQMASVKGAAAEVK